jgi:predicted nucleic acid-binding protein
MEQTLIHLDTSFLIRALIPGTKEDHDLQQWINSGEILRISAVAWAEFLCGLLSASERSFANTVLGEPVPFASEDAACAAALFNQTGRRRGSLTDCMIAATVIGMNASLATSNPSDFQRFQGLRIAN